MYQDDGIADVDSNDEVWYYFFGCSDLLGIVTPEGAGFFITTRLTTQMGSEFIRTIISA